MRKLPAEIQLRPHVSYDLHWTYFHETQYCPMAIREDLM